MNVKPMPILKPTSASDFQYIPYISQRYEYELANLEYNSIKDSEKIKRLAYFKEFSGEETLHHEFCDQTNKIPITLSKNKIQYFKKNKYAVGYGVNGLYPYKGKFHGQMIRSIINILGLENSDILLDPFAGSGTTNIEASLLNINSIAMDVNPFSRFLTTLKNDLLLSNYQMFNGYYDLSKKIYPLLNKPINSTFRKDLPFEKMLQVKLCYLSYFLARSYDIRNNTQKCKVNYDSVIKMYYNRLNSIYDYKRDNKLSLGKITIDSKSSATDMSISSNSVDGIITSPPYSNMLDYPANDEYQNRILGFNISDIRSMTIGIRNNASTSRIDTYLDDLSKFFAESFRVLKSGKYLVFVIGYKELENQKYQLKNKIFASLSKIGFIHKRTIKKSIPGYRNKLLEEEIYFYQKQ
ncbi:MAG: site-specific DNA-methyltransferase [Candidatus Heimdallarchaeota archaeon]|nr:site-specific DNA-methyltransferase [Candidatus Heimdallarchaeota archaeon]